MTIGKDIKQDNLKHINKLISTSVFFHFIKPVCIEAGQILNKSFGKIEYIKDKSSAIDLCTNADIESEKFITQSILKKYPHHTIISEEGYENQTNSDYRWIIDPLDGTTNYVHNLPIFSISIGLQYKNDTILGIVYNPAVNKFFHAIKNEGAFLNNKPIAVSSSNTLSNSMLATGFPYSHDKYYDTSFLIFKDFYDKTQGIRRLGVASLDLCFVAMGRFDGFYEFNLKPWDICAGAIIAVEAGGVCTDWNNQPLPFSGSRVLCSNNQIHNDMINILNKDDYKLFYDLK